MRQGVFSPLLGIHDIFTQEGAAWKHFRELLRKQLVRTQYQNSDNFRTHVDDLLARLPATKGVVNLQPLFFKLTLDTTTALLLDLSVHSLKLNVTVDTKIKSFAENFDIAQGGLAKRFRIAPWHSLYNAAWFRLACSTVHQFVDNYIQGRSLVKKRKTDTAPSENFLDQLAKEASSHEMLRYQLLNILFAGRDTTAFAQRGRCAF